MRNQEWNSALAELNSSDLAELVLGLLGLDAVDGEAAFGVVDEAEVFARLVNADDVHETCRVCNVGADLAVHLDEALHHDGLGLAVVERILEAVADEHNQRHAVAELVGTGGGTRSIDSRQFVEKPVLGGAEALLVLFPIEGDENLVRWILNLENRSAQKVLPVHKIETSIRNYWKPCTYGPRPIFAA